MPEEDEQLWDTWKVLVYDSLSRDSVSTVLKVADLRDLGVTLFMNLEADRQAVPDVPAVYMISPTEESVNRICRDIASRLYESFYINFTSPCPRVLLQKLAHSALEADAVSLVSRIYDQHVNFVALEKDLFSLHLEGSFTKLNAPSTSEAEVNGVVTSIVNGLMSVMVTLAVIPIIRATPGGAAEAVARLLDARLREEVLGSNRLFSNATSYQRPVLMLLDRHIDLSCLLQHPWTYQALVHDLLRWRLNQVVVDGRLLATDSHAGGGSKSYDLDVSKDPFWKADVSKPFPTVIEDIEQTILAYKEDSDKISQSTRLDGGEDMGGGGGGGGSGLNPTASLNTKGLVTAIEAIPEMQERKKVIDAHTNIATAISNQIKQRELDSFFILEESMMHGGAYDKELLFQLLTDSQRGTPPDKMRLFLIYFMCTESIPEPALTTITDALTAAGCDLTAFSYAKTIKSISSTSAFASQFSARAEKKGGDQWGMRALQSVYGKGKGLLSQGIKNFLPSDKAGVTTRIVEGLMDMKTTGEVENYLYLDPKLPVGQSVDFRNRPAFREGMAFIVGGGNFIEYGNIKEYMAKKEVPRTIMYGCTEFVTSDGFLSQLSQLGNL